MSDKEEIIIAGSKREQSGKSYVRKLRRSGRIPANLNDKGQSIPLELDPKFLHKAWQSDRTFILDFDGQNQQVKITELQLDPVKRLPLHVDLTSI